MLSISEFSEMSRLSPQTLRHYHAEGLLPPARVNAETGYRFYTLGQVERAVLIAALRRAGLTVRDVRRALEDTGALPELLARHRDALRRQRQCEDEALADAHALVTVWPRVERRTVPAAQVLTVLVPGGADHEEAGERVRVAARELVGVAGARGLRVTGRPWKRFALDTAEEKRKVWTPGGPDWTVAVPVAGPDGEDLGTAPLPKSVRRAVSAARDEVSVVVPGRESTAKLAMAFDRLARYAVGKDLAVDLARPRHVLGEDGTGTELAAEVLVP
ncbi:MerR family transcriptional regulator [Streptomyces sp. YS415]|uniref:MerR family transcriptional regulator n=1 Tax=Streptomyces sp. YS415 TaxID=2944806 RepID=UPI00201FE57F|nr:MerR family transcriptional regulator [Streptomyces sp. YS415]MCL7430162.1 MerR family transcriptional regulator [Streptomyces sp. YS415]